MSNIKYGETSWDEPVAKPSGEKMGKDTFLRLRPGSNIIRVLTLPHAYYQHHITVEGGKKWGYKVRCADPEHRIDCPVCQKYPENRAKKRYFLGVIDRASNTFRVLDIGYGVHKDIKTFNDDEDWGNPSEYDFDIVVDPNGGPMNYYSPVPKPKRPLSAGDIVLKEDADLEGLKRMSAPPSVEKIQERLDSILAEVGGGKSEDNSDEEEGEQNFFKNYDKSKRTASF